MTRTRVLLVGRFAPTALERSYASAFDDLGCEVRNFDIAASINRYCRLGRLGRYFNTYVPVEPWVHKADRELIVIAREFRPSVLIVVGQNRVRAGALAQIRSMLPLQVVFIWPDSLKELSEASIASLPLYDLVATYGRGTLAQFQRLGARRVEWVALAGDPHMASDVSLLSEGERNTFGADISFIGQWRPERGAAMQVVLDNFGDKSIKIWGPDWGRRARGQDTILKAWQGRSLYEKEYHHVLAASRISLNIIDDTNYPAANMRFFEIPMAGGVQVASPCPELEGEFKHGEAIFYYHSVDELVELLGLLLSNDSLRHQVADASHKLVVHQHTYQHRAQEILGMLNDAAA